MYIRACTFVVDLAMFLYLAAAIANKQQHYSYTLRNSYPGVSEPEVIWSPKPYRVAEKLCNPDSGHQQCQQLFLGS
ncbi:hypothetical protein BDW67DRAFT_102003 [Aspergillus spinulosporus]